MFSTLVYPLLLCPISTAFAKPLQTLNDQPLQPDLGDLHLPSLLSSMPYSSNTTWSSLNTSVSNALSIKCDGEEYGFNPDVRDCTNALMRQLVGREQVRFGQRDSVSSEKFLPLPYRLMGDKALCYLQPVLLNGAEFSSATFSQIRDAASELVLRCASSAEQGGIATNFGRDSNLALILGIYKPDVECRGTFPSWKSCTDVLAEMPASMETLVFGPEVDPDAQVILPHFVESDDRKCLGRIWYSRKESDTASWYTIWEAATAVFSICNRKQQSGSSRKLGDHGNLFLTMTPQVSSSGNISLDDSTYIEETQNISDF